MNARITRYVAGAVLALIAAAAGTARAGQQSASDGRFLGREEIKLYGLNLTVTPPEQVVPKDMATIVTALLQVPPSTGQTPPDSVSPFAPDAELRATLRGPSLATPLELAVKPGNPFNIPALKVPGIHMLENIRLVSGGEVLLRGNPESARIEVIEKLLVTQVTARALTADEIRERGIVFDRSNFQAYNFTAAFAIQDTPIQINFPVLLPRLAPTAPPGSPVATLPAVPTPSIPQLSTIIPDTLKLQTRLPNLQVVGFSLKIPDVKDGQLIVPPIPGLIAIPGDIGFLNQYFSVLLMVGNVAPAGSGLVVSNLEARIVLPPGRDNVPGSSDDPLRMAMTSSGEAPVLRIVAQPGADGKLGTSDDITTIGPGESGNAEYLVEGRREGSHIVEMQMTGTLNGLPVGPVPITGSAKGAVLVRNPTFTLTFTHPEVVTAGEKYTLDVTVTNTSSSPANVVSVNLQPRDIGGATLKSDASQSIDSIAPGDSATVSFALESRVTGRVIAATLESGDGLSGRFGLKTSVGELGVPMSPDSLVLPKEAGTLPKPLREAVVGLLGKAWAVATAPAAAVPADLIRFSRKIVLDRAVEVAEAGLRVDLQEPVRDSATQLALDFLGSNFPRLPQRSSDPETLAFEQNNYKGFDLLRRRSIRGDVFANAIAALLRDDLATLGPAAFHEDVAEKISYRPGVFSVLLSAPGAVPARLAIADPTGNVTGGANAAGKVIKDLAFSELLAFRDAAGTLTGEMAFVGAPQTGTFTVRLTRVAGLPDNTPFTLSLVVPGANDQLRHIVFENVVAGQRPTIAFADGVPYRVVVEWVNANVSADVTPTRDAPIVDPPPSVISVIQREKDDKIVCEQEQLDGPHPGRIVAVLFSEEVTPASVQDKVRTEAITHYAIDGNAVVGVALQPGRRIAFLALRDPYGPHKTRSLTISNVTDPRGRVIVPDARPIVATVKDPAGVVSGQVLRADGTPAAFVNVRLFYRSPCDIGGEISWIGISSKMTDAEGRFSWDYVLTLPARIVAVDAETGDVRNARFRVQGDGQRVTVNLVFLGRGTLTGRTFGPDGRTPLADTFVKVTSMTDQSEYGARSDSAGRYTIANVPVGSFVIDAVNTAAVAKTTESDLIPFAGATTTHDLILLDAKSEPVTLKKGNINGFVFEADGSTPVAGVPVIAFYQSNSQSGIPCPKAAAECPVAVAATSATGAYAFPNVVAGSLRLQTFNQSSYEQGAVGVVLAANQTLSANIVLAGGLGTVKGIVIDASGNPVAGADVGGGMSVTQTDGEGRFTLIDVPVGRREIVAVSNAVGSMAKANVDLLYAGHEVYATLVLEAMGSVAGLVTKQGSPVRGVQVYVFRKEGDNAQVFGTATTNDQGGYRIDRIPVGEYRVSAFAPDFSDGNIVPAVVKFHKQVVQAPVAFRGGGGVVKGRVFVDSGNTPVRARVSVSGEQVVVAGGVLGVEFRRVENFRIVDTHLVTGEYAIGGLFAGPFTVRAAGVFSPDPIAVNAEMPSPVRTLTMDLRLQPTSQLTGTVFMPDGTKVGENVAVHFKSDAFKSVCSENAYGETTCETFPQGVQSADAVTKEDGTFLFPLLNAGKYTLTVEGPGGRTAIVKGALAAGEQGRADVTLLGRADLTVRVHGSDPQTIIPGANVEVSQVGAPVKRVRLQADDNGVVTFGGADAFNEGELVIVATDRRNGATGRGRARITKSETPETVDVYISSSSGVVHGRVQRREGGALVPAPNAEVAILSGGNAVAFATTDADGKYREIGIPLGAVRVEVFDPITGRRGANAGQLATDGAQLELNVVEEGLGVVRGRVVAAVTLEPLRGWRVTLSGLTESGRSMPPLVTTTAIDGAFSFPGTPIGAFTITAVKPGEPGSGSAKGTIVRDGELVEVPVIATIPREPKGTLVGTVVDHLGAPVGSAHVDVYVPGASLPTRITARTDGSFTFGPTRLGRYHVRATRQGSNDSGTSAADLSFDGQTVATSVVLNGLGTVKGIVMQNDDAVPNARVTLVGQPNVGCEAECSGFAGPDGRFVFERVSARTFTVTAANPSGTLRGSVGDRLNPGETKENVIVRLETTRRLTARILDGQGNPAAGVVGDVKIGTRHFFAESGANGQIEFAAVPLGGFVLDLRDATGPGMAVRRGTIATDVSLGDVTLDEAPPRVAGVTPLPAAVAVPRTQGITLRFSEAIDRASINAEHITLTSASGPVTFELPVYSEGDTQVVLQPSSPLQAETVYTLTVSDVVDRAGRPMAAPYAITFTTVDVTPPSVADAFPAANATGVSAFATVRLRFSEAVAPPPASAPPVLRVSKGGVPVEGRVDFIFGNTVVVFSPNLPLSEDTTYQVHLDPVKDLSGNAQTQALDYTFTTTDRTPPQVTALAAAGDGTVIENGFTDVIAQVSEPNGVASVDFYLNDRIGFTARTAPFQLRLQAVPTLGGPGDNIKVTAYATDTSGNRSTSPATLLVPIKADAPPTVTLLSPAAGGTVANGSQLNITVRGNDDLGLTQVGYRVTISTSTGPIVRTGADTISPATTPVERNFSFQIPSTAAPGAIVRVEPTALDAKNQAVIGSAVELRVLDTAAPAVVITGVSSGAQVKPGESATVVVKADDAGLVRKVTFTASGAASFTKTYDVDPAKASVAASFTFTVPPSASATESVTLAASAIDVAGNSANAANVVLPIADLVAPTITLRTQTGTTEMVPGSPLVVIAEANDQVGVTRIELTGSGAFVVAEGRDIDPPSTTAERTFTILVPDPLPNDAPLQLQARARDKAQNISAPASLTLTRGAAVGVTLPASTIVNAGSTQNVAVGLTAAAGPAGVHVDLATENPSIATVSTPVLFAEGEGTTPKSATITAHAGGSTSLVASVQGVERARMTITVQGGIVTGFVLDPDENPITGALVTVRSGPITQTTTSGDGGAFTVNGIPGPSVEVRALDEASGLYGLSRGTMPVNGSLRLDVVLIDAGSVSGIVRRADGNPVNTVAKVEIFAANAQTPEQTVFTNEGAYEFPLVALGTYRIEATDANGNRGRANVTITNGQPITRDVQFLGRGTVKGVVQTAGEEPVIGAAVTLRSTSVFGSTTSTAVSGDGGTFEFTGVFEGNFEVTAERAATGEAGEASGTLTGDQTTEQVLITLSPVGSLSGIVRRTDESTVSGATVTVGARSTTTNERGEYSFAFVPAGPFTVKAAVAGTREQGIATGTITAGQPTAQPIVLAPQGRLQVTVKAGNDPVIGAEITVTANAGELHDILTATTGDGGVVLIDRVLAGAWQVTARANGLSATTSGTLAAGQTAPVSLTLETLGTITGTVFEAGRQQTATTGFVQGSGLGNVSIGADGVYTFTNVRPGTYNLAVFVNNLRRAIVRNLVVPATSEPVTRDIELAGIGTVNGRVLNGGAGVANALVRVENDHPDFAHAKYVRTDGAGFYQADGMVFGPITASSGTSSDTLRGEASGLLDRVEPPLTLDILLTNNATTLPKTLADANGSKFDMQMHGGLGTQSGGFYNAFLLDIVADGQPIRFTGEGIPTTEQGAREIATRQANLGGLNVTRKLFVPATGYFGRWLEILSNPTTEPITVDVRLTSVVGTHLGTHPVTSVIATSSGDSVLDVQSAAPDRWVVVDDATDADPGVVTTGVPAVAFAFDGPDAAARVGEATHTVDTGSATEKNVVQYTWQSITVQPGERVALMHFGVRQMSRESAAASAERLVQLPPEALAGLNPDELPIIRNFAMPAGGSSTLLPLPAVTGRVTGVALAGDETTPISDVVVRFKSDSLFYGRTYSLTKSAADGTFALQSVFDATSQIAVSIGDGFTLNARHPETGVDAPSVTGAFAAGQTEASANVIFRDTGLVKGIVKRHDGAAVTTGTVTLTIAGKSVNHALGGVNRFAYTGVPAGQAALKVTHRPAGVGGNETALTGSATVTIVPGQVVTQDLTIEPTGAAEGLVKTAGGGPAIGVTVYLERETPAFTRSTTTDTGGHYSFNDVPVGDFVVRAVEPATSVSASAPAAVTQDHTTPMPVLTLIGHGTLTVNVTYGSGQPVGDGVAVQITEVARGNTRGFSTNDGQVIIPNVTTAGYTLKVIHPADTTQFTLVTGTIEHNEQKTITVALPKLGTLTVKVRYPNQDAPGVVPVEVSGGVTRSNNTNASGDVTFTNVPGNKPFMVRAAIGSTSSQRSIYREVGPREITQDNEQLDVNVTLPAMATLAVTVHQGGQPATGARVAIRHAFATAFGNPVTVNATTGMASFTGTPEGLVRIRVTTSNGTLLAEGDATIRPADHGKTVAVTIEAGVPLPRTLTDANTFQFDIAANGRTAAGTVVPGQGHKAYDSGLELRIVADGTTVPFAGSTVAQLEANGRELVIRNTDLIAGLDVTRKVFVPASGYFARYLEILHNTTDEEVTVDLEVASDLDSETTTRIVDQNAGQWIVTDDDAGDKRYPASDQTLAHVFAGMGAAELAQPVVTPPTTNGDTLSYRWNAIRVPARGSVALMHFAVQQPSHTAAQASAIRLAQAPPEALVDLAPEEIAAIGNFDVPEDGVGTVPPLAVAAALTVTGDIFTYNGTTLTNPRNEVILRSGNPIYSREFKATVGTSYSLTGTVADSFTIEAINKPPAPFDGWQTPRQTMQAVTAGQTSATEPIVFSGTGTITGSVHLSNGSPVPSGTLTFSHPGSKSVSLSQLVNGAFTLPVVTAGTYTMSVDAGGRVASSTFTVAPNAITPVDLSIRARASVRIQVNKPNSPDGAVSPSVTIRYGETTLTNTASATGLITFSNVPEGPFTVHARETQGTVRHQGTVAGVVTAADEGKTVDVTVPLKAIASLRITVTRGNQAVIGAPISVWHSESGEFVPSGTTNGQGQLVVGNVPAGPFEVRVRNTADTVSIGSAAGTVPQTAEGQTIEVPIALTTNPAAVQGTLYAADGQTRLRGYDAYVRLFDGDHEVAGMPTSTGAYAFAELPAPEGGTLRARVEYGNDRFVEETVSVSGGQTATRDITVPIGAVTGTVRLWDGSIPEFADLTIDFGGDQWTSTTIDEDGRYVWFEPPTGQFVTYAWIGNIYTVTVGEIEGPADVAVADIVIGRISGTVTYADGSPASRPTVFVTQTLRPGLEVTYDATSTDTNGNYVIIGPQGTFNVQARSLMLEGTASVTISAGNANVDADIELEADGVVTGTVRDAGNAPLADVDVVLSIEGLNRWAKTDASGQFRFEHVKFGPFTAQARVNIGGNAYYATASGVLTPQPPAADVLLKLPATGAVGGVVVAQVGDDPVAGAEVVIENRDHQGPLGSFTLTTSTGGDGAFAVSGVPVGQVRVSAFSGLFGGWNTGLLTEGPPATINVKIGSLVKLSTPYVLDSAPFRFDINCQGQVARGGRVDGTWATTYLNAYSLSLDGAGSFPCVTAAEFEDGQRELRLEGRMFGGLRVERKIAVPEDGGYARFLEILTNTGTSARTVRVRINGGMGNGSPQQAPVIVKTPAATGNTYSVARITSLGTLGFVFAGQGGAVPVAETHIANNDIAFYYAWDVTVPAGETVILMHFAQQGDADMEAADARARELAMLARLGLFDGMTAQEKARVVNFRIQ